MRKKDYKKKRYDDAIEKLERAKSLTEKTNTKLRAIDAGSVGAVICGFLYQKFAETLKSILIGLCTFGIGAIAVHVLEFIKKVSGIIEEIKANKNVSIAILNTRYDKINGSVKMVSNSIDRLINVIKLEKEADEEKEDLKKTVHE